MAFAILNDLTKCGGCGACAWACKEINELPKETGIQELNGSTFTSIERVGTDPVRRQCMHCEDPACVSVCPVGALQKTPEGPVIYDQNMCIGCRYCLMACPFSIPRYQWESPTPLVRKCIMCYEKLVSKGEQPACTAACPTGAAVFGDREELLDEAFSRIRNNPGQYVRHIYGQREAGGTSVLYLSSVPFAQLGFKTDVRDRPYSELTWNILEKLPLVVTTLGALMTGIWWITHRREEVAREEAEANEPGPASDPQGEKQAKAAGETE